MGLVETSKVFEKFGALAERDLAIRFPKILDSGAITRVSIGSNRDSSPLGVEPGYRVGGAHQRSNAVYMDLPDRMIPSSMIRDPVVGTPWVRREMPENVQSAVQDSIYNMVEKQGLSYAQAFAKVQADTQFYMYRDQATNQYVVTPVIHRVNDSVLSGLTVPYWNVSYFTKVYKQPFVQSFAKNLVSAVGVPNAWADIVTLFTESFEGYGRISTAARGTVEPNNSNPVRNRMNQIVSEIIKIVVDYEHGIQEVENAKQIGNYLVGMAMSDRERYARMIAERMYDALILFGNPESNFEGLVTIAGETLYTGTDLATIYASASTTKGADVVDAFNHILADAQEAINFLPTKIRINVSATAFKVLKYTMFSNIYNPESPATTLANNFNSSERVTGATNDGIAYELVVDPMCNANTPFNTDTSDLMFITFPEVKSAFEDQKELIMAPVALDSYIVPPLYQRSGYLYTNIKRVGSLIAPVENTILVYRGFGVQ
jgi:hypothetical protein